MTANILLSIKPYYAEKIFNGEKTVEFRKNIFKKKVDKVYVYSSSPIKKIIGLFKVKEIVSGTPADIWERFKYYGGIPEQDFFSYYSDKEFASALVIEYVIPFENHINPHDVWSHFKAPQNFIYVGDEL